MTGDRDGITVAVLFVSEHDRHGQPISEDRFKQAEALLARIFGGFTARHARSEWRTGEGLLIGEPVRLYELTLAGPPETLFECAREIATLTASDAVLVRSAGTTYYVPRVGSPTPDRRRAGTVATDAPRVYDWPKAFDVGVLAVIPPELSAVHHYFHADRKDTRSADASVYYRGTARGGAISVVIHCQGHPGNHAAALATERLIAVFRPRFVFLVGIAAGRKGKIRIGDVVVSRIVADDTGGVAARGRRLKRPLIQVPPYPAVQWFQSYRHDQERWHSSLMSQLSPPRAPRGSAGWYKEHVARFPNATDAAIYSSNLLLKDPKVLAVHAQQTHEQMCPCGNGA